MEKFSLDDLRNVQRLLSRQAQILNWVKEIDDQLETLQRQRAAAERERAEIEAELSGELAELVAVARELADNSPTKRGKGDEELRVYNPNYVTNQDKEKLLLKILCDFKRENPGVKGMTFQQVLSVLQNRYGIQTRTIGNFFKHQLDHYKTEGGNRKKYILLDDGKLDESQSEQETE